MNRFFHPRNADYAATLQKGVSFVRGLRGGLTDDTGSREDNLRRLKKELEAADAVVIGAGAGLSTSAGLTYSGERFERYFFDFKERFGITDMYSGGFFPFPDEETRWAWWARHIYYNRYIDAPRPVYRELLTLLQDKDYLILSMIRCFLYFKAETVRMESIRAFASLATQNVTKPLCKKYSWK